MTISELIAKLEAIKAAEGDLEVAAVSRIADYTPPDPIVEDLGYLGGRPRYVCVVSGYDRFE